MMAQIIHGTFFNQKLAIQMESITKVINFNYMARTKRNAIQLSENFCCHAV